MELDLRTDTKVMLEFFQKRIAEFGSVPYTGIGSPNDPISEVLFGYQCDQAGWVAMVFDTQTDPSNRERDHWSLHIPSNELNFPEWYHAFSTAFEEDISILLPNGQRRVYGPRQCDNDVEHLAGLISFQIGDAILASVRRLIKANAFASLPLRENAVFLVEDHDHRYAYPTYDRRAIDGLLKK